jgi:hypothetical protein
MSERHALTATARRVGRLVLLATTPIFFLVVLSGCANVKPWEKEAFARPDMAWDPDPLGATLEGHIRFSKEAALPSSGGGGGGCGCN